MKRPKINLPNEPIDNILDLLSFLGVAMIIGMVVYYYGELPERIPRHFNARGEPDAWGGKGNILTFPILGVLLFIVFFFVSKIPHHYNYPMKITMDNAAVEYRKATRMMRVINFSITLLFIYITWQTIQTALGNSDGLGSGILIVIGMALAALLGYTMGRKK